MKITVKTASGLAYTIANHGETSPLDDSRIGSSFVVQEVNYFRAVERKLIYRGQHAFDQTIHVSVLHDRHAEVEMLYRTTLPLFGLVEFEMLAPQSRAVSRRYYLRDAAVMMLNTWNIGQKSTEHIYRIMGGMIREAA